MLTGRLFRVIGYWRSREEPGLPDPGAFVDPYWAEEERSAVLAWLESRKPFVAAAGPSWCRFRCAGGLTGGTGEITDGTYVWPQGLAHYVREHHVRLPAEVVEHVMGRSTTQVPVGEDPLAWWSGQRGFGGSVPTWLSRFPHRSRTAVASFGPLVPSPAVVAWFRRWLAPEVPTPELLALLRTGGRIEIVDPQAMHEPSPPGVMLRWGDAESSDHL